MKNGNSNDAFFDDATRMLFCIHRAYYFGFITRHGMNEICDSLCIEKERNG
jgi:tRNA nucleotidyltransferase/poly(A) polymerase